MPKSNFPGPVDFQGLHKSSTILTQQNLIFVPYFSCNNKGGTNV